MKIKVGDKLENIKLNSIDDKSFELNKALGKKILLTFYRFAACPMCNLRINEINKTYSSFGENFIHVAIFDSKLENLKRFTKSTMQNFQFLQMKVISILRNMKLKDHLLNLFGVK